MKKGAIMEHTFDEIDMGKSLLDPYGYAVAGQKSGKDPVTLTLHGGNLPDIDKRSRT